MRNVVSLNRKWAFTMDASCVPAAMPKPAYFVNVPHSWNAIDGQDGAGDFHRGLCYYVKSLSFEDLPEGEKLFLEIQGANASADLYVGGKHLCHHDGGYSTWRVDVTEQINRTGDTLIVIGVDNSPSDSVYPQVADFTFYGGLYRNVNLIGVPESHFDLEYYGGPGIAVTPTVEGKNASVKTEVYLKNAKEGQTLRYTIKMP
ncbi:MAG: glycoside hydrolase family 2 protein, partial [Clostridia bacterium]|nr:glycoside hydrolase family 2 protein [Clostridia bacterium]